mmetsp:Transcript_48588/g.105329  ORF Transcript_48588/g.105329 Transcript_48588/m.105329 type:complete len:315 (-) Transcript_48588:68-1012(-)|eukprot:6213880-Pleurochrysis_carterae.AAC.2
MTALLSLALCLAIPIVNAYTSASYRSANGGTFPRHIAATFEYAYPPQGTNWQSQWQAQLGPRLHGAAMSRTSCILCSQAERGDGFSALQFARRFREPEVSIAAGLALLLALVVNRLFTEELLNSQSRADLIATIAPVVILLDALTSLDITPREAEPVSMTGVQTVWQDEEVGGILSTELQWAADALIENSPCTSLAVYWQNRTVLLRGIFAPAMAKYPKANLREAVRPGPLLNKCAASKSGAPEYLPALQLLPGRIEFSYFPEDAQGVLIIPLGAQQGAVILATDRVRAFKEDDIAWARLLSLRMGQALKDASI